MEYSVYTTTVARHHEQSALTEVCGKP